ncbi:MAG TPA: protein kinase [Kofleriaceae bacterium]
MDSGDDKRTGDYLSDSPGERLTNGTEIEGYVVDGILGKGGMGVVYSATHAVIGKRCAIKVLRMEVSTNPTHLQRFIQEARAVNAIGHPNIIDIFDFGELPDGRAYHLMDLMVGESLRERLNRGPLSPDEAAEVLGSVASALAAAHDKGFIHRDLKPDNIFLLTIPDGPPQVKLLDFGLAKLMPDAGTSPFVTKTGIMLGTPEYMSPEQARGEAADYRTDIYALGILTYECLVGERPFPTTGDTYLALQYHAEEPAPSLGDALPDLPDELVQLVDAMLTKERAARPSLAAVRTVIKRLRSTKLDGEASFSSDDMRTMQRKAERPPANLAAELITPNERPYDPDSTDRDGTAIDQAPLHTDQLAAVEPPTMDDALDTATVLGYAGGSTNTPRSGVVSAMPEVASTAKGYARTPADRPSSPSAAPPMRPSPVAYSPDPYSAAAQSAAPGYAPAVARPAVSGVGQSVRPQTPSTPPSASGLAQPGAKSSTVLGVEPARVVVARTVSAQTVRPRTKKMSPLVLAIGALVFIALGIALAFVISR